MYFLKKFPTSFPYLHMLHFAKPASELKLFVHKYTMPLLQKYPLQAVLSMLKSLTSSQNRKIYYADLDMTLYM